MHADRHARRPASATGSESLELEPAAGSGKSPARKLPIIITTNYSGDEMRGMAMQANVMEPMIRRLKEFCDVVIL